MTHQNGFYMNYLRHQSKIFWVLFIVIGIFLIGGSFGQIFFLETITGFLIIIIGIEKLRDEIFSYYMEKDKKNVHESINYINTWMESTNNLTNILKDKYNDRIFKLDNKQSELNRNLEMKYREIVRKIIEIENKLNDTNKILKVVARSAKITIKSAKKTKVKPRTKKRAKR